MSVNAIRSTALKLNGLRTEPEAPDVNPSTEGADSAAKTGRPLPPTGYDDSVESPPASDLTTDASSDTEDLRMDDSEPVTSSPPVTYRTSTSEELENARNSQGFLDRLHIVVEGGYALGGEKWGPSVRLDVKPYIDNAAFHRGLRIGGHASYSILNHRKLDLRFGVDAKGDILRSKPQSGVPQSSHRILSLGGLGEFNYFPIQVFGVGAQVAAGAAALISNGDTDVGAPFPAKFSASEDWGFRWAAGLHLLAGPAGMVRIGGGVEHFATKIDIDVGEGQIARAETNGPRGHISAGIDIMAIINYIRN